MSNSNTDDNDDTHRVINKSYHRNPTDETFEPGDSITPSDGELAAFAERFEPLSSQPSAAGASAPSGEATEDSSPDESAAADEDTEDTEDTESSDESSVTTSAGEFDPANDDPHELTSEGFAALNYAQLRQIATQTENVSGNAPEGEMRDGLASVYNIEQSEE